MRGDFSAWDKEKNFNFRGTLHQQGRVLLDRDWNAQTEVFTEWQETAARDTIGAGVAAVPADAADSFKVTTAEIKNTPDRIEVSVKKGRVWADGLLVNLYNDAVREAIYLEPPIQNPAAVIPSNPPNSPILRDAVILESWLEEMNAFQMPDVLIEPALGGVDTTERIHTAFRFRLFRMDADDTCDSIIEQLKDNFANKGKLKAVLQPDIPVSGDCPTVVGGGYTGFEHQLYRVEIAQTAKTGSYFKWSQFNGGLVGRGVFNSVTRKLDIKANKNAIIHSGLTDFYLEAVEFDAKLGYWKVIYGAKVTLGSDNLINLPAAAADVFIGTIPTNSALKPTTFFRLWNKIERVNDYTAEKDLQDGIRLQFEAEAAGKYTPNDYWTFPVRAGEIANPQILIDTKPPEGIFYHRVPLAEINWTDETVTGDDIEDCRRIFQPLTKLKNCCTYRVGDGINSHGDFKTIQAAVNALPKEGGEICVLNGVFVENVVLKIPHNRNIAIKGCGSRSRVVAFDDTPVFHIAGGNNLKIESLAIEAHEDGVGILLEGDEIVFDDQRREVRFGRLRNISLEKLLITAAKRSAIEMHVGTFVSICHCQILIKDLDTEWAAVYLAGDDLLFERNEIRVLSDRERIETRRSEEIIKSLKDKSHDAETFPPARRATGGLHLGGGCERVRVINNIIIGGIGNGINLGSVDVETDETIITTHTPWHGGSNHDRGDCFPNPGYIDTTVTVTDTRFIAGAPLRDILIERNRIYSMGRNGIGVDAFFVIETEGNANNRRFNIEFITVENLVIIGNRIEFCLNRPLTDIPEKLTTFMGYGGIALSVVEMLVIRDNFIRDNGANFLNATCGIYILKGEGIEISRNHILNNGRFTNETPTDQTVKNGARGGIFIFFATEGSMSVGNSNQNGTFQTLSIKLPNGIPALKLHENIVSVPMGRALTMLSTGNVSITDNHFLSQSIVPGFNAGNFFASLILILSLNTSSSVQKQPAGYQNVNQGKYKARMRNQTQTQKQYDAGANAGASANATSSSGLLRNFLSGGIHFADNQCELINRGRDNEFVALAAITILSLDDVGFLSNQVHCSLIRSRMITDTFIFGLMVRASDNSWQEVPLSVFLSAITFGFMNTTTDNHSTHCLLVRGLLYLDRHNLTLFDLALGYTGNVSKIDNQNPCERILEQLFASFGKNQTTGQQPVPPPTPVPA
jgi:hypothetical protein